MNTSVTEEPTIDAAPPPADGAAEMRSAIAGTASLPPRGTNPSLPPDANPEPLPIGIADMWRLAQKTYRAERPRRPSSARRTRMMRKNSYPRL
jgi:hypothetical protein